MAYKQEYMELAIELAKKGTGAVNPNPLVGAVIVKDDRIIGQGYHARYGDLHAERAAFASLTEDATGAEMYVTLEPCCHYGKQPPCTLAIVEHGIKKSMLEVMIQTTRWLEKALRFCGSMASRWKPA